ncbi:hypothetical protein ACIA5C_34920 [Actinoplanes sp. NPDC051343]|uniref:hypothetical protein n=1 Tax=Actinoplanes sp. NPDC051343 TaxID=3363906 RepID=UPI0037A47085
MTDQSNDQAVGDRTHPRVIRSIVARAALIAGGTFATAIVEILGATGTRGPGDQAVLCALVALCVTAASTMFTAAFAIRPTAHPYSSVAKNDESPDEPSAQTTASVQRSG